MELSRTIDTVATGGYAVRMSERRIQDGDEFDSEEELAAAAEADAESRVDEMFKDFPTNL